MTDKKLTGKLPIAIGVPKREFYLLRFIIYGHERVVGAIVTGLAKELSPPEKNCLFISGDVKLDLIGTEWENRLKRIELPEDNRLAKKGINVYGLEG